MPRPLRPSERRFVFAISDAIAATLAVVLAMWTWSITVGLPFSPTFVQARLWWFVAVPIWTVTLVPTRHASAAFDLRAIADGLLHAGGALLVAYLAAYFSLGAETLPRLMALYVLWNAVWLTLGGRLILLWTLTRNPFAHRPLVVGDGEPLRAALESVRATNGAVLSVPFPKDGARAGDTIDRAAQRLGATEVIVATTGAVSSDVVGQLLKCQEAGIDVVAFPQWFEHTFRRVPVRHVDDHWMLTQLFAGAGPLDASPLAKLVLDVGAALVLLPVGAILGALASMAILIESGRPVFYSQTRLGRAGRRFRLTKFRTMRQDAEADGAQWSPEDDPRITRVGRVLRRTHIDELPNVWAVFRGDMSMVGPRPERPEFLEVLERDVPLYRARLTVAPGLTGWAQVNTEYGDSVDDTVRKLEYDLYYVRHRSLSFDLAILARTVGRMLGWKGR
ncbi:MAG: exopolysaccharide biosynthesis polyprenyl glycosylphosphotransferase [Acidobacteria bacterium]|nr:exopolysaccharide biosynthesis polyprenyl glycosylphosphotransferase [Acidobacteriota bacterium]